MIFDNQPQRVHGIDDDGFICGEPIRLDSDWSDAWEEWTCPLCLNVLVLRISARARQWDARWDAQ